MMERRMNLNTRTALKTFLHRQSYYATPHPGMPREQYSANPANHIGSPVAYFVAHWFESATRMCGFSSGEGYYWL